MKQRFVIVFVLGLLLISPLILAEEQNQIEEQTQLQTYSGFERFVDNVRMFFSGGDSKVQLALEIREKEVNSALVNIKEDNSEEANKNLENAFDKLVIVQEQVSLRVADEVTNSVDKVINQIEENNLSNQLNRYVLEEQKTQVVAKLVVEVNGKEGQTLKREIVKDETGVRNMVMVVVQGENGEIKTIEMEGELAKINNQIAEHTYAGGKGNIVATGESNGNNSLVREVAVDGGGTLKNDPLPVPDLHKINPDLYNPNARAPGDTIDETYDDNLIIDGDCGDGVVCSS